MAETVSSAESDDITKGFTGLIILPVFVGMVAYLYGYTRRRLNDLNQSGWWCLILLVPFVSFFFSLYILFSRGTNGSQEHVNVIWFFVPPRMPE